MMSCLQRIAENLSCNEGEKCLEITQLKNVSTWAAIQTLKVHFLAKPALVGFTGG